MRVMQRQEREGHGSVTWGTKEQGESGNLSRTGVTTFRDRVRLYFAFSNDLERIR